MKKLSIVFLMALLTLSVGFSLTACGGGGGGGATGINTAEEAKKSADASVTEVEKLTSEIKVFVTAAEKDIDEGNTNQVEKLEEIKAALKTAEDAQAAAKEAAEDGDAKTAAAELEKAKAAKKEAQAALNDLNELKGIPATATARTFTAKLRSFIGNAFNHSFENAIGDISGTTAKTAEIQVNDGPAIGSDGTVYVGTTAGFKALDPKDLSVKFTVGEGNNFVAPAITEDSENKHKNHYVITATGKTIHMIAIDENGKLEAADKQSTVSVDGTVTQVASDDKGNIYVVEGKKLHKFTIASKGTKTNNVDNKELVHDKTFGTDGILNLNLDITRPILIAKDAIVVASDDTVLVVKNSDGSQQSKTTGVTTSRSFLLLNESTILTANKDSSKIISLTIAGKQADFLDIKLKQFYAITAKDNVAYFLKETQALFQPKTFKIITKDNAGNTNTDEAKVFHQIAANKSRLTNPKLAIGKNNIYCLLENDKNLVIYQVSLNDLTTKKVSKPLTALKGLTDVDANNARITVADDAIYLSGHEDKANKNHLIQIQP